LLDANGNILQNQSLSFPDTMPNKNSTASHYVGGGVPDCSKLKVIYVKEATDRTRPNKRLYIRGVHQTTHKF